MLADFDYYVGKTFKFYGVDHNRFKLDDTVWEAIEDPDDGWRSYLGTVEVTESQDNLIFSSVPLANVKLIAEEANSLKSGDTSEACSSGYQLVDVSDGHIWLEFGTDHTDWYYPYFYFNYQPKQPTEQSKPSSVYNMKEGN